MNPSPKSAKITLKRSLALSLIIDLSLVAMADEYEGLDQWVYSTDAALSNDLRASLRPLFKTFANELLFDELVIRSLQHESVAPIEDLAGLVRWISELNDSTIRASHLRMLERLAQLRGKNQQVAVEASLLSDQSQLSKLLHDTLAPKLESSEIRQLLEFLMHPRELQAELTLLVVRFWDRHYRLEYARCRPLEQRSIERLHMRGVADDPLIAFKEITGRNAQGAQEELVRQAKRLVFIPSCHGGAYASTGTIRGDTDILAIAFNCLPSTASESLTGLNIGGMFPPLKALADETRLEILGMLAAGELYAQQVVDRMTISQSAVSRHLRLLVACGLLRERRQEGMKFYSINEDAIGHLSEQLAALRHTHGSSDEVSQRS